MTVFRPRESGTVTRTDTLMEGHGGVGAATMTKTGTKTSGTKTTKAKTKSGAKTAKGKSKRTKPTAAERALLRDKHVLYEASVQSPEADLKFFRRVFKRHRGRTFRTMREDFCGTSLLSCTHVGRHEDNVAWGVDLDGPTLAWGRQHHVEPLGDAAARVHHIQDDVMEAEVPPVDLVCALNFSYWIFKERATLLRYFRRARAGLVDDGIFFVDAFGGQDAMDDGKEERRITDGRTPGGRAVPNFTYVWDQARFNVCNHDILCHIHFKLKGGKKLKKAFTYDWRFWTLPEIRDLMIEAGFADTEVYMEGWDEEEEEADGIFRRRTVMENDASWVAYVVGLT